MGKWSRIKVNSENINNGNEYEIKDRVSIQQLNSMVNAGLYSQDFAEHLADAPDVSEANQSGTPSIELIDNIVNGIVYKKFKFKNLLSGISLEQLESKLAEEAYKFNTLYATTTVSTILYPSGSGFIERRKLNRDARLNEILFFIHYADNGEYAINVCKIGQYRQSGSDWGYDYTLLGSVNSSYKLEERVIAIEEECNSLKNAVTTNEERITNLESRYQWFSKEEFDTLSDTVTTQTNKISSLEETVAQIPAKRETIDININGEKTVTALESTDALYNKGFRYKTEFTTERFSHGSGLMLYSFDVVTATTIPGIAGTLYISLVYTSPQWFITSGSISTNRTNSILSESGTMWMFKYSSPGYGDGKTSLNVTIYSEEDLTNKPISKVKMDTILL